MSHELHIVSLKHGWDPDPDEPTSELYRLMPPRRNQLREALDAAHGTEPPAPAVDLSAATSQPGSGLRQTRSALRWLVTVVIVPLISQSG
jgi:hypothetical protein